jgi:hypothetical protein
VIYFYQSFIDNHYQLHWLGSDKLTRRKRLPILPGGRFFAQPERSMGARASA